MLGRPTYPSAGTPHPSLGATADRGDRRAVLDQIEPEHVDEEADRLVVVVDQERRVFEVHGDHLACVRNPDRFVPTLVEACSYVAAKAARPAL